MVEKTLEITNSSVDKLNELYETTYSNYRQARHLYKTTCDNDSMSKNTFIDYVKYLEAACALDKVMSILNLSTNEIETKVDKEYDYE